MSLFMHIRNTVLLLVCTAFVCRKRKQKSDVNDMFFFIDLVKQLSLDLDRSSFLKKNTVSAG